jgi:hypothetical protein
MKLYRYERGNYACYDRASLSLKSFEVSYETPKGYWIHVPFHPSARRSGDKWVSSSSIRRYAYPTEEEALLAFKKRTERCISILEEQLNNAKMYHKEIENKSKELKTIKLNQ